MGYSNDITKLNLCLEPKLGLDPIMVLVVPLLLLRYEFPVRTHEKLLRRQP